MKTLLNSVITYAANPKSFAETIAPALLPDTIRMYTKNREFSHFEESHNGKEASFMRFPNTMKLSADFIEQWMKENSALSEDIKRCSIGEKTHIEVFEATNSNNLSEPIYNGILLHLTQDDAFDQFIRNNIDCSDKYNEKYYFHGTELNGPEVRQLIDEIDNQCICAMSKEIYERYGVTVNQNWFDQNVKPVLDAEYNPEMAEGAYKYMKLNPELNRQISEHDYLYINEGPLAPEVCEQFLQDLMVELNPEWTIENKELDNDEIDEFEY